MERVELLTVEECFLLNGVGLVLAPDFSVPREKWRSRLEQVLVITPEAHQFEAQAELLLTHFNVGDSVAPLDRRWRIVITLPALTKERVPVGSRILVSPKVRNALLA
ncbi:MAG: hypothetical protein ACK5TK_16490 [Betaproteobacteria bacterium]